MQIPEPTTVILAMMAGTFFGLVSVPHCIGMCGPLHLAMCLSSSKRSFKSLSLFNIGRLAGYTVIGALCGLFGSQLTSLFPGPTPAKNEASTLAVPKSCCAKKAATEKPKIIDVPKSCCAKKAAAEKPKIIDVPKSCCAKKAADANAIDVPKSCCEIPAAAATTPKPSMGLTLRGRQMLMYVFPAIILLFVGIKGLLKKPASVGTSSGGLLTKMFAKFKTGGPSACGVAASLIPCGMLYVAFGIAVSTLSPLLGGVMLFFYCLTITFFLQLGIMVGATFGKKLGPTVDKTFPWVALVGAAVYLTIFFRLGE